ncbi:cell division protein FtsZ [Geothrix paludis]|uniref:cell division protein FtsZ n=1 Tax=Geothrix paludis TaxID=2922722 RepID=UPI001FAE1FFF|nr:cell division protein FtsZ [Geothrix paludis]
MSETPFLPCPHSLPGANIKVLGVGGAGCNAINRMIESGVTGVQFIAMNTDQQSLSQSKAHLKLPLGPQSSRGLGAGGSAERGAVAAEESREEVLAALQGADMVFITGGMGGGTGTGAAPVLASFARELGALTVAVVLTPFAWEGRKKGDLALSGLANLRETADTVIVVSNERLKAVCDARVTMKEAFRVADGVLIQGVRGIADLILKPGIINGDFADVEAVLRDGGEALIGTGAGRGEEAVMDALKKALACPLLERAQTGAAANVMVSITADWEVMEASAIETAMNYLQEHYNGRPDIKACTVEGEGMEDRVLVTVLASGFDGEDKLLQDRRHSLNLAGAVEAAAPTLVAAGIQPVDGQAVLPVNGQAILPVNGPSGRVYGEVPASEQGPTPTRLLPQAPTPSGELPGGNDDLHVPAIIRLGQGRLPIE